MDSRTRVKLALQHREPDRVPIDFWASSGCIRSIERATGRTYAEFLDEHDVDLRYIEGPGYIGPALERRADGCDRDIWGVLRRPVSVQVAHGLEQYMEVAESPLAAADSVAEVEAYAGWPSADWFDYSAIAAQCEAVHRAGRAAVFMGDRLNRVAQLKPAMYLRGVERILMDMVERPEMAHAVLGRISQFYGEYEERILTAARGQLDILLTGDDFGSQAGPLVSPRMWAEFLGRGFADYCAIARRHGVSVMHHTCGSVRALVPLLIERGLDVLQSLQPEAAGMDHRALKAEYGQRLGFHGGISIQRTLPFGTPEQVAWEVQERIAALAPGGGYILGTAHNIQADTPPENIAALLTAYHEFGRYT